MKWNICLQCAQDFDIVGLRTSCVYLKRHVSRICTDSSSRQPYWICSDSSSSACSLAHGARCVVEDNNKTCSNDEDNNKAESSNGCWWVLILTGDTLTVISSNDTLYKYGVLRIAFYYEFFMFYLVYTIGDLKLTFVIHKECNVIRRNMTSIVSLFGLKDISITIMLGNI